MSESSKFTLLLYFLVVSNVLCVCSTYDKSILNDKPFWINPCGYSIKNEEQDNIDIIDRILTLANFSKNNIDLFKFSYIKKTFNCDYFEHYQRLIDVNNSWMTPLLLKSPEDNLPDSWLSKRSFPEELEFTHELLQRVAVGFEMLVEDAKKYKFSESFFLSQFVSCKNDLRQLLCETSDGIDITLQTRPVDVPREIIPNEVKHEESSATRNLTNSIIFRDYMIAIKYILNTYGEFKQRFELFYRTIKYTYALP